MDKDTKKQFNNLIKIIEKGFNEAAKKADVDKRFNKVEKQTDEKIDGLAGMVKRGFDCVDKRFNKIEMDIIEIKEEIKQIRIEIKQIWNKLDEIEKRLDKLSQTSKDDVDAMTGDVLDLKQRVNFLENQIKELKSA